MTCFIFAGPTLAKEETEQALDAICLPPASQGDVYRAALRSPRAIGIVDGYFEAVPAVWHKEILWAMSRGIYVFGSASIGALRAAELAPFGMRGVGWIYRAYREGLLQDDDEVAVTHGPVELAYPATSEAMVNIRRTLASAVESGVIPREYGEAMAAVAKGLFFKERSFPRVIECARDLGVTDAVLEAFSRWLPAGRVDQKHLDGREMLEVMKEFLANDPPPMAVSYVFENTYMWSECQRLARQDQHTRDVDGVQA